MIARTSSRHFDDDELAQLLGDALPPDRVDEVQSHVSSCVRCQTALSRLAGEPAWWDETVSVLKDATLDATLDVRPSGDWSDQSGGKSNSPSHPASSNLSAGSNHEPTASVDWIQPMLQPSEVGMGRLDEYPIDQIIGQGGMGVVLRGNDLQLGRPVAIKVLSPHLAGVGAARARFMREAQSAAGIVHPAIVPIYRVVPSARLPYLVMPLIDGGNLQQRIDREGPLDLAEVLDIGRQIAEGLAAAHRLGLIHRDIKPANILVESGNGRVLISDFGLARALDDASLTVSGMIAGTPQYMSPEQARGEAIDVRSDLFSLGSLLYTLATGRPPFRADHPLAVLKKITESSPRPITTINERMPPWIDRLVGHLMAIDADDRIESASRAAELLTAAHAHVQNPSAHPLPDELRETSSVGWSRSLALATTAVLVGTLGWWAWSTPSTAPSKAPSTSPSTITPTAKATTTPDAPVHSLVRDEAVSEADTRWLDPAVSTEMQTIDQVLRTLEFELESP